MPAVVMKSLKKILLSRVELWMVAVLLSLATLGFGAFMKDGEGRVTPRGGAPGRVAFRIGSAPENLLRRFFRDPAPPPVVAGPSREQRFHGRSGLEIPPPGAVGESERRRNGYLVVLRHVSFSEGDVAERDGAGERRVVSPVVVDLVDLNRRKIVHSWTPGARFRRGRFFVLPDGSLLVDGRRASRMDACSNVVWERRLRAHHSFERDADGNFWSPLHMGRNTIPDRDFVMDGFVRFSPAGEVLSRIELSGALMRAGHRHLLHGHQSARFQATTPVHMNDVEPVLRDGPFWRRGDLFVSLRNSSVVLLHRPATDEVLWLQAGPWLHQHDVDVVSDSEISVFSNNTVMDRDGNQRVSGANEVYVHDFATGETRSPWREAMRRHDVRTEIRGGATVFGDGSVMLEEAEYGRILMLSPDGERVWSYVNRASDGAVRVIQASRWLDAEYGAGVMRSIAALDCGAETD